MERWFCVWDDVLREFAGSDGNPNNELNLV
jgi:hypothetical protein